MYQGSYCSGPRQLTCGVENLEFRHKLWDMGFLILHGISNVTEATQEMDNIYQVFNPCTYANMKQIASIKIARQVATQRNAYLKVSGSVPPRTYSMPTLPGQNKLDFELEDDKPITSTGNMKKDDIDYLGSDEEEPF